VYDNAQRLCKTIEPETGATVQDYDAANNLAWRASGLTLPSTTTCDTASVPANKKITYGYDLRNRLTSTTYSDGSPAITRTYTPDGLPFTNSSNGTVWTNTYNKRRLLTKESLAYGGKIYNIGYGFNANASPSQLTYPDSAATTIAWNPNALGEPSQVGSFATGIAYYPNGAISGFTYGNGINHIMQQNARGLPQRSLDAGVIDDVYSYDENGNVVGITDDLDGIGTRTMGYDALDRLYFANAPALWGNANFQNDALDNITSTSINKGATARASSHSYDPATNRLINITSNNAQYSFNYGYDAQGNVTQRGTQAYVFDQGNRLASVTGKASTESKYVYLSGTLLTEAGVAYAHTDALGSPVARTNAAKTIVSRTRYEPYGLTAAGVQPTIGFTGHVNDADTGLINMQQRYYDPVAGRFLSVDPVVADNNTGGSFNRYNYAKNSPYKYIDPDGRNPAVGAAAAGAGIILYIGATKYANDPQFRASTNRIFNAVVNLFKAGSTTTTAPLLNNGSDNSSAGASAGASSGASAEAGKPTSPQIDPKDVGGKKPEDIEKLAGELGLQPKGPDPLGGAWCLC
jgi:RHS repeat-associated protein